MNAVLSEGKGKKKKKNAKEITLNSLQADHCPATLQSTIKLKITPHIFFLYPRVFIHDSLWYGICPWPFKVYISTYTSPWREGIKKREAGSFQWCPVAQEQRQWTHSERGCSPSTSGNAVSLCGWLSTGMGCLGRWWSLPFWRLPKSHLEIATGDQFLTWAGGLDQGPPKVPSNPFVILWFHEYLLFPHHIFLFLVSIP